MEKLKINEDACLGCGACVGIAPDNFAFGEGCAKVINETPTDEAKEALDCCPGAAISIVNE